MKVSISRRAPNRMDIGSFLDRFDDRIRHVHASGVQHGVKHAQVSIPESHVDLRPHLARFAGRDIVVCIENRTLDLALASKDVLEDLRRKTA